METGIGGERLGESSSPSRSPPFFVLVRSSSAFPPMSCLEIGWRDPDFQTGPSPRRPHSPRSRLFRASDLCIGRREVPSARLPRSSSISVGAIAVSPDWRMGGEPAPPLLHRPRGRLKRDLGESPWGDSLPEPFPVLSRTFLQLIGVSADELLGNSGPRTRIFRTRPLPSPSIRFDRGFFEPPIVSYGGGEPPRPIPPVPCPSLWAASAFPPFQKTGRPVTPGSPSAPGADWSGN